MKNEKVNIKFLECEDAWMIPFIDELVSHIEFPNGETTFEIYEIDERYMRICIETVTGTDENGYEIGEECYAYLRYWIDEIWPEFCVSYCLYIEGEEKERGAYQIVHCCGQGECIPIEL